MIMTYDTGDYGAALDKALSILKTQKAGARVIGYIDEGEKGTEMMW